MERNDDDGDEEEELERIGQADTCIIIATAEQHCIWFIRTRTMICVGNDTQSDMMEIKMKELRNKK